MHPRGLERAILDPGSWLGYDVSKKEFIKKDIEDWIRDLKRSKLVLDSKFWPLSYSPLHLQEVDVTLSSSIRRHSFTMFDGSSDSDRE